MRVEKHKQEYKLKVPNKIEPGAVIHESAEIGTNNIFGPNCVIRNNTKIGNNNLIGPLVCVEYQSEIGDNNSIQVYALIGAGLKIGNNYFIGPHFVHTNKQKIKIKKYGMAKTESFDLVYSEIQDYARIGANVKMAPGITIGHHALIDMDCLITHDVPPYAIVRGGKDKIGRIIGYQKENS